MWLCSGHTVDHLLQILMLPCFYLRGEIGLGSIIQRFGILHCFV